MTRVLLASLLLAAPALAQTAEPADPPALAGPSVTDTKAPPSLVQRDFEGKVKRLEEPADEAALALLPLTPEQRAKADAVLAQRHALLDRLVLENFQTVSRLRGAPADERRQVFLELREALRPLRERGSLADELRPVLTSEQHERHAELVGEYFAAITDETAPGEAMGEQPRRAVDRAGAAGRELIQQIGVAVRRSYERTIGQQQKELEATLAALNLTPEQDAKVRKIILDSAQKRLSAAGPGAPANAKTDAPPRPDTERRRTLLAVMSALTPEQRRILINLASDRR